ncbi:MAG: hypothetical protein Q7J68_05705 [Thermoplasmata archaeon]|nr:hypothetical protein [Thermoplasmata archaeon]
MKIDGRTKPQVIEKPTDSATNFISLLIVIFAYIEGEAYGRTGH